MAQIRRFQAHHRQSVPPLRRSRHARFRHRQRTASALAYEVVGQGPPSPPDSWLCRQPPPELERARAGYQTLTGAGYQVVAMDCRGHGESDKPHDVESYGHDVMAEDARAVMEVAGIAPTFLMGYSMGGFISMHLLLEHPEQLRAARHRRRGRDLSQHLAPAGQPHGGPRNRNRIADALIEPDKSKIADATARTFRDFADQSGKDRLALAACMRAMRRNFLQANWPARSARCLWCAARTTCSPARRVRLPPPLPMAGPSPCHAATT